VLVPVPVHVAAYAWCYYALICIESFRLNEEKASAENQFIYPPKMSRIIPLYHS